MKNPHAIALGKLGGSVKSARKKKAVQANGATAHLKMTKAQLIARARKAGSAKKKGSK